MMVLAGVVVVASCVALLWVWGWTNDRCPPDMLYPVRSDPLVIAVSSEDAPRDVEGEFPYLLPEFEKDKRNEKLDPGQLTAAQRKQLGEILGRFFGTPVQPKVEIEDEEARGKLRLDAETLARGSELYRHHCLHCHGLTGDGHGSSAAWILPHPRDYRPGKFKFNSVDGRSDRKARRDDLLRTLRQGLEGTKMVSFEFLPDEEAQALVSYVIHLSMRGQVEFDTMATLLNPGTEADLEETVKEGLANAARTWTEAQSNEIIPAPYTVKEDELHESISRGHKLFVENCLNCHIDYGRKETLKWDEWGTVVRPGNLTRNVYHGGRRRVDIYYRIAGGINGTPMPMLNKPGEPIRARGQKKVGEKHLGPVNFVQTLPYPKKLPEEVRQQVYGKAR